VTIHEIADQRVDRFADGAPRAAGVRDLCALVEFSFFSDDVGDADDLGGRALVHLHDLVEQVGDLSGGAGELDRHARGEVAFPDSVEGAEKKAFEVFGGELGGFVNANASSHG
jgi:hypothetical protein